LMQGQFFIFETGKMQKIILTIDIGKLDHIHADNDSFTLIENEISVSFGTLFANHMATWKQALQTFTAANE